MVTIFDIRAATQELGLSNHPLCIHASLRSFGWVEGGAATIIAGLLAEGCTLLVPTFSFLFAVPPPLNQRPARNGWDYDRFKGSTLGLGRVYSPVSLEFDRDDMGALPAAVLAMPQHRRGNHPLCSFSAVGPLAHELITPQRPDDVYAPLRGLAETNGAVILMGVGLDKMTLLHLAEQMAGRHLFIRWANNPDRRPMMVESGGCSDGFENFGPVLVPVSREKEVGTSRWRVFPVKEVLAIAVEAIRQKPEITHCDNSECNRCNDAVMGGPIYDRLI